MCVTEHQPFSADGATVFSGRFVWAGSSARLQVGSRYWLNKHNKILQRDGMLLPFAIRIDQSWTLFMRTCNAFRRWSRMGWNMSRYSLRAMLFLIRQFVWSTFTLSTYKHLWIVANHYCYIFVNFTNGCFVLDLSHMLTVFWKKTRIMVRLLWF